MGFTIFEESGNFDPTIYGLKAGDCIHVVCVGGGGGGAGCTTAGVAAGTAGSASSFGSVLTAAGGNAGVSTSGGTPTAQTGSSQGLPAVKLPGIYFYEGSCQGGSSLFSGGVGGNGWLPGVPFIPVVTPGSVRLACPVQASAYGMSSLSRHLYILDRPVYVAESTSSSTIESTCAGEQAARTDRRGGMGGFYCSTTSYFAVAGIGGVGYGAGGGGASYMAKCGASGGNGGVVAHADYVLTDTSVVAVTVGAGGDGCNSTYDGGGGARGCVAIYW